MNPTEPIGSREASDADRPKSPVPRPRTDRLESLRV